MIKYLFIDLDDTILDFHKAERIALSKTLMHFGVEPTDDMCELYSAINKAHWERLERKEITRPQVLLGRFREFFRQVGHEVDPRQVAAVYEENLSQGHYFLPGAEETVKQLSDQYPLYLASNGTSHVQAGRLKSAGIIPYFQEIFVSQDVGADKPSPEYFERCFAKIPGFRVEQSLMVGDSLTSDMRGGIGVGMQTCWVAPKERTAPADVTPDYRIESLAELPALLDKMQKNEMGY